LASPQRRLGVNLDSKSMKGSKETIKKGYFKLSKDQVRPTPFIYIPSTSLQGSSFDFDNIFVNEWKLRSPSLIFYVNSANDPEQWNFRTPPERFEKLIHYDHNDHHTRDEIKRGVFPSTVHNKNLKYAAEYKEHYCSVLRENCRRLLRGVYTAATEANVIFRISESWNPEYVDDVVPEFMKGSGGGDCNFLGVAGYDDYDEEIVNKLKDLCEHSNEHLKDEELVLDISKFKK
jgi:hypothetical protein